MIRRYLKRATDKVKNTLKPGCLADAVSSQIYYKAVFLKGNKSQLHNLESVINLFTNSTSNFRRSILSMFSGKYIFLDNLTEHSNLLETIGLPLVKTLTCQKTQQMATKFLAGKLHLRLSWWQGEERCYTASFRSSIIMYTQGNPKVH